MVKINWFPGHMKKNLDMMKEEVKDMDAIIYMLDARAPFSCLNPSFVNIIGKKPIIYVLNKSDLVQKDMLSICVQKLSSRENSFAIVANATVSNIKNKIVDAINLALKQKITNFEQRGAKITLKAMIIGVPNCGKSTLANTLAGKSKAKTGDKAGVTVHKQWVRVSPYVEILDTPGTLWPSMTDQKVAENLAFIGSIKEDVLDRETLSMSLVERLRDLDIKGLEMRYGIHIEEQDAVLDIIEKIASAKGFKVRGGELDFDRAFITVLQDYKHGKITNKILDDIINYEFDK